MIHWLWLLVALSVGAICGRWLEHRTLRTQMLIFQPNGAGIRITGTFDHAEYIEQTQLAKPCVAAK
jgi:hypothetical protein